MRRPLAIVTIVAAALGVAHAADRAEIRFADGRIFPESVTSTRDGTIYAGSLVTSNGPLHESALRALAQPA